MAVGIALAVAWRLGLRQWSPVSARRLGVGGMAISGKRKGRTNVSTISINQGDGRRKQPKVWFVVRYHRGMFKPTNQKIWAPHNFVTMTQCIPPTQIAHNSIWGMFKPTLISVPLQPTRSECFLSNTGSGMKLERSVSIVVT